MLPPSILAEGAVNMDEDAAELGEEAELPSTLKLTDCVFCSNQHDSFEATLKHMASAHSFFVPEIEFLVDMEGAYLEGCLFFGNVPSFTCGSRCV